MAAPKNPNPGPAAKKRREQGDATAARRLRAAGWLAAPPESRRRLIGEYEKAFERRKQHPDDMASVGALLTVAHVAEILGLGPAEGDTVGSLRATLAAAEATSWDGWKNDEA